MQAALENAVKTYYKGAAHRKVSIQSVAQYCKVDSKTL
jgi:hypothetical protein